MLKNHSKLNFIVRWDKIKEKTWSGTSYSLFLSLQKFFNIHEIQLINIPIWKKILLRIFIGKDLGRYDLLKNRKDITRNLNISNQKNIVFQFTDIIKDSENTNTFVYQDMSVSYIKYMYKRTPERIANSEFDNIPIENIEKREQMEKEYFNTCSGIFTMGEWYKKFLIEKCQIEPSKVHHVGGGVNIRKDYIDYSQKQGNKILFIGRNFKRKGGDLVYKAFTILKKSFPECELHVAGPIKNPINTPINGYYFHGDCTKEMISALFNKCDIFCMPSYFEAYGLVFIEALTYGLPCIGRNAYEMPYFIKDNVTGYLIENDDEILLAKKMNDLLKNQEIMQNVRNNKEHYIHEYSWDTVAEKIKHIINQTSI